MGTRRCVCLLVSVILAGSAPADFEGRQLPGGAVPGNGVIEPGEACDDGNVLNGDGCTTDGQIEQQCYDPGNTFSFFTWGDSYTSAGDSGVERVFADAVNRAKYANRLMPRFWISLGDIPFMASGSTRLDELNDLISNSASGQKYPFACSASNGKYPYFVALGNHDVDGYDATTPQSQYTYWRDTVGPKLDHTLVGISNFRWGPDNGHDARTTYSFDYKNAHFVIVNQYHGDPTYPTSDPVACARTALYNWIDQDLTLSTRPLRFVFGHEPAWSYCSNLGGYGGEFCPAGNIDNQTPASRPRPYSSQGSWLEPFGRHWGDSLDDSACSVGSREAFWAMLARHKVVAHFNGHTHTYSGRLVEGDGTRRNDVSPYAKTGQSFSERDGVWEIDSGNTHNSAGALYVLTTVRDNVITFESFDQIGTTEPFKPIETWSVHVGSAPEVAIVDPATGATFTEPATVSIAIEAGDLDGSIASVELSANGTPVSTQAGPVSTVDWTDVAAGTYTVTVTVTDNDNLSATSAPILITVNPQSDNHPPQLQPIGARAGDELTNVTFQASAADDDPGDVLSFSLVDAPGGAEIDAATGIFTWTPTEEQGPATHRFTVRVRDNATYVASADETILVTVAEVNEAPAIAPLADATVNEVSLLTVSVTATDPDLPANGITFSLVSGPPGAAINALTGALTWTPNEAQGPGTYAMTVRATDTGSPAGSADRDISITLNEVNLAPVLASISNKTVVQSTLLTFTAIATDADVPANAVTYSLLNAPTGAGIDPVTGVFTWTPTLEQIGAFVFSVTATDNGSPVGSASRSVTVTVTASPNLLLTALSTSTTAVAPGGTLSASNTVTNQSTGAAGSFKVAFALSVDPIYGNGDDVPITATRTVTSLAAGATSTASTTLTVPTTTPLGPYYVCGTADSAGTVAEQNESDNARCTTAVVQVGRADLVATQVLPSATTVTAGATLGTSNTVMNQGLVPAGAFTVAFRLSVNAIYGDADDVTIATTRSVTSLAVGASSIATTNLAIASTTPPGTYVVCAKADSTSVVTEADEGNNTACGTSTVQVVPAVPDLHVSAISSTATVLSPGSTVSLSNSVRNSGTTSAGSSQVAFRLSGDAVYGGADDIAFSTTRTISSLGVGATNTASTTLTIPATTPTGSYYLCAIADSGSTVTETNETNNAACTGTTLHVAPAELRMSEVEPGATTAVAGTSLGVVNTVINDGSAASTAFTVAFRLSVNAVYGDADDVAVATTRSVTSLTAAGSSTATTNLAIAGTTPPGDYLVCAQADSANAVVEADEGNNTACGTSTVQIAPAAPAPSVVIYGSSTSSGNAGAVVYEDEDILAYDNEARTWSLYFDGSDVGLGSSSSQDIKAFVLMPDGSILLSFTGSSFTGSATVPNVGSVTASDIVRFIPTSLGTTTAGTYEWYFDGSDVGLTTSGEKVDATGLLSNGDLLLSTTGDFSVPGVSGSDEDLIRFTPTSLGANTTGTWTLYFDGSDVGLDDLSSEDVSGVWVNEAIGDLYLTTVGTFSVSGASGDGADIIVCTPATLGANTSCTFAPFWDGSANGFGGVLDGFTVKLTVP